LIPRPPKPAWSGPFVGGITQSLIIRFLECPFRFYLYAYCGLQETEKLHNNLVWGDTLHKGLEHILEGEPYDVALKHMVDYFVATYKGYAAKTKYTTAHMLKLYPSQETINFWEGIDTEVVLKQPIKFDELSTPVLFRGKADMVSKRKDRLGDHKAKGRIYPAETRAELNHDLQMNLYAKLLGIEEWQYDLIQIPEEAYKVPEIRAGESSENWAHRIFYQQAYSEYNFPIARYPKAWIVQIPHFQPMEEIDAYFNFTIKPIALRMVRWWEHVTDPNFDPNNPACYNDVFYHSPARLFDPSRTDKFKPHFHSIITNQIGYDDLVPVNDFYAELPDE